MRNFVNNVSIYVCGRTNRCTTVSEENFTSTRGRWGAQIGTIPKCSGALRGVGKMRYSNTASRFPMVIYRNPCVYRQSTPFSLAQPAHGCAGACKHARGLFD